MIYLIFYLFDICNILFFNIFKIFQKILNNDNLKNVRIEHQNEEFALK